MSVYADYPPDQQQRLTQAIGASAVLVSVASLGSKADTVSDGFAAAEFVLDSLRTHVDNTLITSVIVALRDRVAAEQPFPDYADTASAPGAETRARGILADVAALLDTDTDADEAAGYKRWLVDIARITAQGATEDHGFLGRGGVEVNDAERDAIVEVGQILGLAD